MALRLSTGAALVYAGGGRNSLAFGSDFTFSASAKRISSASNQFGKAEVGDMFEVKGSAANTGKTGIITAVGASGAYIDVDIAIVNEAVGTTAAIAVYSFGKSMAEVFRRCVIGLFTGVQPTTADDAETGTILGYFTADGNAFVSGEAGNGIILSDAVASTLNGIPGGLIRLHADNPIVTCNPIASGTAGWVRFYDNDFVTGLSTVAKRMDMACGIGTGEFRMSSSTVTIDVPITVNSISLLQKKAA